jgi:N-glycosyltransferase
LVTGVLDTQRVRLGLPSTADPWHPHRYLTAGLLPRDWYPHRLSPPALRHYRLPDATAPETGADRRRGDRPLILAGLGSLVLTLPGIVELLPGIVAALGALPCRAILILGGRSDLAGRLEPLPDNVTVLPFGPQRELLARCDLFLTHGGFNSVAEAVSAGAPMVALPIVADQPANARRLAELGLGEWLDIEGLEAGALATACARVLADPAYRRRVVDLREQMLACPDFDALVDDLGALGRRVIRIQ